MQCILYKRRKQLKTMMEHATQFPGEYSKVAGVTAKVGSFRKA